jgi:hypothetical protein
MVEHDLLAGSAIKRIGQFILLLRAKDAGGSALRAIPWRRHPAGISATRMRFNSHNTIILSEIMGIDRREPASLGDQPLMTDILEDGAPEGRDRSVLGRTWAQRSCAGAALALLPVALWCLTHRYHGLVGDSELYAMQAVARTDPGLARDVFLSSSSQDRYTIFSPVYSFFIRVLGLHVAALSLMVSFKLCFYCAIWAFSRKLAGARPALLATALMIVAPLEYGAYHVFWISEDMLTARTLAEALAMIALCLHVHERKAAALAVSVGALAVHALMALPMVLLLLALRIGARKSILCGAFIAAGTLAAAVIGAISPPWKPGFLSAMDPGWLEVVRERSQFLFLQFWHLDDWERNARPFLSLALSVLVLRDGRIRALCAAAAVVGVTGLLVAFIAGDIGPVPLLLQGQAWRWVWVPELLSLLLLVPTAFGLWGASGSGALCAALLLVGWLFNIIDGAYCIAAALCLWAGRRYVPPRAEPYLRFLAVGIGALVLAWIACNIWTTVRSPPPETGTDYRALLLARNILGLDCLPVFLVFTLWYWLGRSRSAVAAGTIAIGLGAIVACAAPGALRDRRAEGTSAQIREFSDWRRAIPPGENVFVLNQSYSAGFVWFTLQRPSYLTVDQSAGVIFSRATAEEVRRRSNVLLPIETPDWRVMSNRASHGGVLDMKPSPLTHERLLQICADPDLGFVAAKEDVGFEPLRHRDPGLWKDWNLYDCRLVSSR